MSTDLQPVDASNLRRHEDAIRAGLATFIHVGNALAAIRDERLYRAEHDTFEDYCHDKWGFTKSRANQLVAAAGATEQMATIVATPAIENEGQARAVAAIIRTDGVEAAGQALITASRRGQVTASGITLAAQRERDRSNRRRQAERDAAERDANLTAPDLTTITEHDLILADPPWRYEHSKTDSRQVENQYPTMTLDEIKTLEPPAADDCILYLWATSPKLTEAIDVMEAWQFTYRTCMVWDKQRTGMGYWARQRHELILIGVRGHMSPPEPADRPESIIYSPRQEHSAKPAAVHELIETAYPHLTKIEMFARATRPGWNTWGNQA